MYLVLLGQMTGGAGQAPSQAPVSTRSGVYTAAQAARGKVLFGDVCNACHPDPFWRQSWEGRRVGEVFRLIVDTMPDDNPGTMSARETADVLAYIFESNGLPPGAAELSADPMDLDAFVIEEPPPATP